MVFIRSPTGRCQKKTMEVERNAELCTEHSEH